MENKTEPPKSAVPEVIVYSTPSCPYCTMAKEYLTKKGIKFTDHDVSRDQGKAKEMVVKSQQGGVPVLEINGRIVVGFDRQLIDDALQRKKPMKREEAIGNIVFDPFSI
ncbi:MAG: glutaredoxin family protein [Candidatus ainarchaeum sp.]|nr:glutaredoxin family protein [Candidatus ainarchaeum sp.]